MNSICRTLLSAATVLFAAPLLYAQASEPAIKNQLGNLRSLSAEQRPAATFKLAIDIRTLPAGPDKVVLANALANLSTEGDAGHETLQAVADTLAKALAEFPVPAEGGQPSDPYTELATLIRYEHVTTTLKDPQLTRAGEILAANDADIEKADFTLKDMQGKQVTFSELRGKVVLVNFWATWCPPCRLEMPDLDAIYTRFQSQGLVVLSITDEDALKVNSLISRMGYHPPVLLDPDDKVNKLFHINGIPKSFVFNRKGKLVAIAVDQRTKHQFLQMLAVAGLHP